jgi:4-hydroxybenzoate polyprenyltransferase
MMNISSELRNSNFYSFLIRIIRIYYITLRVKEIILLGGITIIGLAFQTSEFITPVFYKWILITLSSYTLLGHAFLFNDWSGYDYDKKDENKKNRPLIKGEISLIEVKILSIILFIISLSLVYAVSTISFIIVIAITILNYLYSGRRFFLKSVVVISTIIHGLGASLGFLLGYTFSGTLDLEGIYLAIYFGILYSAGHLNHEILDFESDKKSGISTNANIIGKRKSFISSFILFSVSYLYISFLALSNILPLTLTIGAAVSYPVYAYFFLRTSRSSLDYKAMIWFRQKYRIIFLLWGIFMFTIIAVNK